MTRPAGRRIEFDVSTPEARRRVVLSLITRDGWTLEDELVRAAVELGIPSDETGRHVRDLLVTGAVERRERVEAHTGVRMVALFPARPARLEPEGWTLVEPCCGSGALTLHLLGARRALVPYQGTKWPLRRELSAAAARLGFFGQPSRVVLGDVGPWAEAIAAVLTQRAAVLEALRPIVAEGEHDPHGLYHRLSRAPMPSTSAERAATALWLQRMNYASKAIGIVDGRWIVHGLNTTSAFGRPGTDRFGEVLPQGAALLATVEAAPELSYVSSWTGELEIRVEGPTLVYLDPPYVGTTAYPSGHLDRAGALALARRWAMAGAAVVVSEAEALDLGDGWEAMRLRGGARSGRRQQFRRGSSAEEWITVHRAVRP